MIVFNLACKSGHRFEGWFRSSAAYVAQRAQAQVHCPVCESVEIEKLLTAPRLNLNLSAKAAQDSEAAHEASVAKQAAVESANANTAAVIPTPQAQARQPPHPDGQSKREPEGALAQQELIDAAVRALRHRILNNTEDVGRKFAAVARAINNGEEEERGIRGTVTRKEAEALADEGIAAIPVPEGLLLDEKLH
jgi:hypothetical protein